MTHLKRLIAVFIIVLTAFLLIPKGMAKDYKPSNYNPNSYNTQGEITKYENIYEFEDLTYTTSNVDRLMKKQFVSNDYTGDIDYTSLYTSIIPEWMLVKRGTYIHVGLKYGFLVQTQKMYYSFDYKKTGDPYNRNLCEIFVFKIDRKKVKSENGKLLDISTHIEPVISNLCQYEYNPSNKTKKMYPMFGDSGIIINHAKDNCTFNNGFNLAHTDLNSANYYGLVIPDKSDTSTGKAWAGICINVVSIVVEVICACFHQPELSKFYEELVSCLEFLVNLVIDVVEGIEEINVLENALRDAGMFSEETTSEFFDDEIDGDTIKDYWSIFAEALLKTKEMEISITFVTELASFVWEQLKSSLKEYLVLEIDPVPYSEIYKRILKLFGNVGSLFSWDIIKEHKELFKNYSDNFIGLEQDLTFKLTTTEKNYYGNYDTSKRNHFANLHTIITNNYPNINNAIKSTTTIQFFDQSAVGTYMYAYLTDDGDHEYSGIYTNEFYTIESDYTYYTNSMTLANMPTTYGTKVSNKNVFCLDGSNEYEVYFTPELDGVYTFNITLKPNNIPVDSYCICEMNSTQKITSLKKGTKYRLIINGNAFKNSNIYAYDFCKDYCRVSIDVTVMQEKAEFRGTNSFTCNETGWYYIEINAYWLVQREYYLDVSDVYTKEVCGGSYYSYTRKYSVGSNKIIRVNNYTFTVKLEKGKTYYIDYYCTGSNSVNSSNAIKLSRDYTRS
ncbi:MAG: hypothetical protein J6Y28_08870 [Acholeplasmatales bacterium]|nr:hypothetical protein [Acholeplasmatales bacterium]